MVEPLEGRILLSLLGVGDDIGLPTVPYDGNGQMAYTAGTGAFNADALPVGLTYLNQSGTTTTARVSGTVDVTKDFALRILLNPQGLVAGGIAGDDLVVKGLVSADLNRDGTPESYSGTLLTGEIVAFGWLNPGSQDQYDFLFVPTGGTLLSYFQGKYVGLTMNTFYNSTFNGLFTENFSGGQVQGNIGPVDKPTLAGRVFFDANNNGIDDAEAGIAGASIALTGTDVNGRPVSVSTTTGADGSYLIDGNLLPGTYSLVETQPVGFDLGGPNVISNIAVQSSQHGTGYNFADLKSCSLAGRVYNDLNYNGLDDGEAGIGGVTITLMQGDAIIATTTTAADGSYSFAGLLPGTYSLVETQPAGYDLGGSNVIEGIVLVSGGNGTGGIYEFGDAMTGSLAGRVFIDANNNGVDDGEAGIGGATIALMQGNAVIATTATAADGSYSFAGLIPGTYTVTETQPEGLLDGQDQAGSLGGTVANDAISAIAVGSGQHGAGYNFGELQSSSIAGFAWIDFNDDGLIDFNEKAIAGVTVTLTRTDDQGNAVSVALQTDEDGMYLFGDLRPDTYTISETQPAAYVDGKDSLGSAGGTAGNDVFSGVTVQQGVHAINYNFGERPTSGTAVAGGQTATIGFWQNKNGQALIKSLNGSLAATNLGNWLASTFPNLYGPTAGDRNMTGKTNAQVAAFYSEVLFNAKANKTVGGPTKVDAQVMAAAFAVYVTNDSLAGTAGTRYGFRVTEYGVGVATFNVGTSGAAFGVSNGTTMTVMDLLLATDERSSCGKLYNLDVVLRTLANTVYTAINEAGDIG